MNNHAILTAKIERRLATAKRYRANPVVYEALNWEPCIVRILLVADDFLYFSDEDFGLSDLIDNLNDEQLSYVRFRITVAHRGSPSDSRMAADSNKLLGHIKEFKFDDAAKFDRSQYDQIWLFGAHRSRRDSKTGTWTNRLTDSELRALMEFMDSGGGVFATGDHEDLGAAMCGFLPRVRQMRRWFFPDVGPDNEGLAPPGDKASRLDTNQMGHDRTYQFDDQSDDIPQVIQPKLYTARTGILRGKAYPHPLLCGPNGPISVLPDHPHEGECTAADNPDKQVTLDGKNFVEFHPGIDGQLRPLPEVIATSSVIGGHSTGSKPETSQRTFGAICAYDGHRAGVGRIVTDATWHHFININLTGTNSGHGKKKLGFLASRDGRIHYEEIKAYFTNIALWISPMEKLTCMRNWGLLSVIRTERLVEAFDPDIRLDTARIIDLAVIGAHARDAVVRLAGPCQGLRWEWGMVFEEVSSRVCIEMGDPWRPNALDCHDRLFQEDIGSDDVLSFEWLGDVVLGGTILSLREAMFPLSQEKLDGFNDAALEIGRQGGRLAVDRVFQFFQHSLRKILDTDEVGRQFRREADEEITSAENTDTQRDGEEDGSDE